MDNRTRNPFDLEQSGTRLRFTALIDGIVFECDARNRQEVNVLKQLVAEHNENLCGLQDACGLPGNATLKARQSLYRHWLYFQNTESQPVAA